MDQEEGIAAGPVALLPHPLQQQQQQQQHQYHQQSIANDYDYSDNAGDDDEEDEENNGGDDDDEEEGEEDETTTDHHQEDQPDEEDDVNQEEEGGEEDDDEDDEAVYPPPVIAEISEDSQEYYMKPPEKMDDGPKPFRCDLCDKRFQEKSSVYRHIKEVHRKIIVLMGEDGRVAKVKSSPIHSCCDTTFTTSRALLRHQKSSACRKNAAPVHQQQRSHQQPPLDNKRKRVNGMAVPSKRNGTGPTATSSEDDPFDEDSLSREPDDQESESAPAPAASSAVMGIPYRCPYGVCPQFFTIKDIMINHLRTAHKMRMELVSISAPTSSSIASPGSMSMTTKAIGGLTSTTISMTDKRFPCSVFGCPAAFTRKDRLNQHIRTRHGSSSNNHHHMNTSSNNSSFMSGLKVKLPSIHHQDQRIRGSSSSSRASHVNSPVVSRPPKETIHPKKHACDYPGCEKSYTKNSHVKRHKLSAHPDLFPQSNGRGSDSPLLTTSSHLQRRPQVSVRDPNDEEEEDDENEEDPGDAGGGSDDDNFEVFEDQDEEPVLRRGRNMTPRIVPTLKASFLSLTSNKSNGNRRKK